MLANFGTLTLIYKDAQLPYSGKLSRDKTFAFLVNFQIRGENFRGENFREWGGVYMWSRGAI